MGRRLLLFVGFPVATVTFASVIMYFALSERREGFHESLSRLTSAMPALCAKVRCGPDGGVLVRMGMRPTPPITFFKEVTLDVEVIRGSKAEPAVIAEAVQKFCNSTTGFAFGGDPSTTKWRPASNMARQTVVRCWVREVPR